MNGTLKPPSTYNSYNIPTEMSLVIYVMLKWKLSFSDVENYLVNFISLMSDEWYFKSGVV